MVRNLVENAIKHTDRSGMLIACREAEGCLKSPSQTPGTAHPSRTPHLDRYATEAVTEIRRRFGADVPGILLTGETGPKFTEDAAWDGPDGVAQTGRPAPVDRRY